MNRTAIAIAALSALCLDTSALAQSLTAAEVNQVIGQAIAEANAQGRQSGAIAVSDRVGNVLGLYLLDSRAPTPTMKINSGKGIPIGNGLEQVELPAFFGAVAKAITGAYLSSSRQRLYDPHGQPNRAGKLFAR